jgi:arylsulfatase A-like enzyme
MLLTRQRLVRARVTAAIAAAVALLAIVAGATVGARDAAGATKSPNVVFILTDDMTTSQLAGMPNVQSLIAGQGTSFNRAYVSFPLCCPSRATMLTGLYMHNHGVHGNFPPNGSWIKFRDRESSALPVRLDQAGYYGVHIGKYMNGYGGYDTLKETPIPVPPGWDEWYGKVAEDALYFNYQLVEKTGPATTPKFTFYGDQAPDYQTDVFSDLADNFARDRAVAKQPFLLDLWFNSPHGPFDPAPRDLNKLAGAPLPGLPAFNEKDISDKPRWFQRQARRRLSRGKANLIANERRHAQEQLLSVDESVGHLIQTLRDVGILDSTYIVFASDNGFFRGEHRLAAGKYLPYDPASRVPLIIRGPGIPAGAVSEELVWNADIAQTILQIATGSQDPSLDGRSLLPFAQNPALRSTRPVLLEGDTGPGAAEAESAQTASARAREARVGVLGKRGVSDLDQEPNAIASGVNTDTAPAYRSIRTDRYEFTVYSNGQTELYDMKRDPAQLNSLARDPRYRIVRKWLFTHLIPLSTCSGEACRVELGPDPPPLPKSAVRPQRKKKPGKSPQAK